MRRLQCLLRHGPLRAAPLLLLLLAGVFTACSDGADDLRPVGPDPFSTKPNLAITCTGGGVSPTTGELLPIHCTADPEDKQPDIVEPDGYCDPFLSGDPDCESPPPDGYCDPNNSSDPDCGGSGGDPCYDPVYGDICGGDGGGGAGPYATTDPSGWNGATTADATINCPNCTYKAPSDMQAKNYKDALDKIDGAKCPALYDKAVQYQNTFRVWPEKWYIVKDGVKKLVVGQFWPRVIGDPPRPDNVDFYEGAFSRWDFHVTVAHEAAHGLGKSDYGDEAEKYALSCLE